MEELFSLTLWSPNAYLLNLSTIAGCATGAGGEAGLEKNQPSTDRICSLSAVE